MLLNRRHRLVQAAQPERLQGGVPASFDCNEHSCWDLVFKERALLESFVLGFVLLFHNAMKAEVQEVESCWSREEHVLYCLDFLHF